MKVNKRGVSIMNEREKIIRLWFDMWLYQKDMGIDDIFAEDVLYTESWCPQYSNRKTVKHWFQEWNTRGKVVVWEIKQFFHKENQTSVYKGYKRDKIEMRVDRVEVSDFPLYLNTVAGGLDRRDQTIGGFSFVVKIYAVPVVEIIGQLLYLLGRYGFNTQFSDCL